ncbi:hypothetical protein RND81_04G241100 [Saponaria officinalis]|uniref:Neprosin PEP catalytic domain-containing protein n=1 Tax=Saponaria officinalis TaxID=3572 RepID=A0AAW1LQ48_SAPOF
MANLKTFLILMVLISLVQHVVFGVSSPISIKMNNGQIFKCVNFYQQPAFRNHLLNHEVMPNVAKLEQQRINVSELGFGGRGCPFGMVPILERDMAKQVNVIEVPEPRPRPPPHAKAHCRALVRTVYDANKKFVQASGAATVYKPEVQTNQWSSSRVKLINGDESIEAGWMVNPSEFKNNEAHLYVSFNVGGKGCINVACSGFVQVHSDVALGTTPSTYSTSKKQILWNVLIEKHQDDGNWWFSLIYQNSKIQIGYWPQSLFTLLKDSANQVEFGGEINDPNGANPPPEMGNGNKAEYDTAYSSAFLQATINNAEPTDTEKDADCTELYTVKDAGTQADLGRIILFGGPYPLDGARV